MDGLIGQVQVDFGGKALVPFVDVPVGGVQKKGKTEAQQGEDEATSKVCEVDMEATGPGAAGKLTGPRVVPRQEQ